MRSSAGERMTNDLRAETNESFEWNGIGFRKLCQYCRAWTEEWWHAESSAARGRLAGLALAGGTALLYAGYGLLRALRAAAAWALQPLLTDEDRRDVEVKVTNYLDEVNSKALSIQRS